MSTQKYEGYCLDEMIYKEADKDDEDELDDIYVMIYKPNENKEEKIEKMEELKKYHVLLLDDEKEYTEDVLRILGKYFVKQNKNKCKIVYKNKKYKLKTYLKNYNRESKEIKIKLVGINNIGNMEEMFYGCYHLTSVSEY